MPQVSEALLPLFVVACIAGLLSYLLPEGSNGRMSGALKGFTGLCILLVMVQPMQVVVTVLDKAVHDPEGVSNSIAELFPASPSEADGYDIWAGAVGTQAKADIEAWVTQQLEAVFGIPARLCRVTVEVNVTCPQDGGDMTASVDRVWIILSGQAVTVDPHGIEAYFERQLHGDCTVSIGG